MTTLLEALQKQSSLVATTGAPGVGSTDQVADLLKAKTGRAVDFSGMSATPRMSTLGEASAIQQSNAQMGKVQAASRVQTADLATKQATVDAEAAAAKQKVESARLDSISQRANRTAELMQEYKQARGSLDADRAKSTVEQIGFGARLSSEKYVAELERMGAESRLEDEIQFKEASAKAIFLEEAHMFSDQFRANEMLNMRENQWREWLGSVDINVALAAAGAAATAANQQALWTGAGNLAGTGVDAYAQSRPTPATASSPTENKPATEWDYEFVGPSKQ